MGAGIHSEAVPVTLEGFLGARQPDRHQCGQNQEGEFFHDVFPLVGGAKRRNYAAFAVNVIPFICDAGTNHLAISYDDCTWPRRHTKF